MTNPEYNIFIKNIILEEDTTDDMIRQSHTSNVYEGHLYFIGNSNKGTFFYKLDLDTLNIVEKIDLGVDNS
jgi:hypothetical protein